MKLKLPNNVKDKGNGLFEIRVTVDGRRKSKYIRPVDGLTKRQIEDFLANEKAKFTAELTNDYTTPLAFGEVLQMYLADTAVKIRDTTRTVYRGQSPRIIAALGHIRIDNLTSLVIQRYIDTLSAGLCENNKAIISSVCKYAKKLRMIDYNPAEDVELPEETRKEKDIYTREEVGQILTALANYNNDNIGAFAVAQLRLYVEWALHSGMRNGELLGLSWLDIDTVNKTVHIHQQLISEDKKLYIYPKTKNGKPRTINIPDRIINLLTEYKKTQQQERERMGCTDNGMVFIDRKTGGFIPKHAPDNWFEGFCNKCGFRKLSPHSYRHFFATTLLNDGVNVATVAKVIGDKIATVIDYYIHAEDGAEETACLTITNAIENALKTT